MNLQKSVITCDLEGRIETYDEGAEALFGWAPCEVIGKKRVSVFSPGLVVLGHVQHWLQTARQAGAFDGDTVFVRKDGSKFAAHVRITPTSRDGRQIGYCGVTVPAEGATVAQFMPRVSIGTRLLCWMVITRAPFLTATLAPVLLGAAIAATAGTSAFSWAGLGLALLGALALHVAANTFNDYFDWKSGTDAANTEYFQPYSGGSRSIELGLVTEKGLFRVAVCALAVAIAAGTALVYLRGPMLLAFGAVGALAAFFYTAPPVRLVARGGLGELLVGICFGPLMVAGARFAADGVLDPLSFVSGVPLGLLTLAILFINEFPDASSDAMTGKNHLVVVLGKKRARWFFLSLLAVALCSVVACAAFGALPPGALVALAAAPLAVKAGRTAVRHYNDRELVAANVATIRLHMAAGLLMVLGVVFGSAW